jgi:cell division protein FtsB
VGPAIRWDRVGRYALLAMLGTIVLLYISPAKHWLTQSRTAHEHRTELWDLERQNATVRKRISTLRRPETLEREARRLGMVRRGERAFVIENLKRPAHGD